MNRLALALAALVPLTLVSVIASADHGDAFLNEKSGRCIAVPEPGGEGRNRAADTGNAPFSQEGSTCDEENGTQPPYGDDNPFPECSTIPGLIGAFPDDCGEAP